MKFMKGLTVGILIGILLTGSAFAAVQYNLSESEWKVVVDGQPVQDERYPVLLLPPGYNYMAVGSLRSVCEKAGIEFNADVPTKEVRITTTKEEKVVSTQTATPEPAKVEYVEPATIEVDGKKLAFIGDISKLLKPSGYYFENAGTDKVSLFAPDDKPVFKDIPYEICVYNNRGAGFIDFVFYEQNIKPLVAN